MISYKYFSEAGIVTPSPEQRKIADFLSAVDKKIELLKRKKELLEQYKKGVMQQIFSQQIRFKDENGEDFPDWEERRLKDIATRIKTKNKDVEIKRVLTNSAIQGILDQEQYFDRDIANENSLAGYYITELNDFVYNPRISESAPVGPIKKNNAGRGVMSPLYSIFRFFEGNVEFYEHLFETSVWHRYIKSVANYGARHDRISITNSTFHQMPLPFPSIKEQKIIAEYLNLLKKRMNLQSDQLNLQIEFKKGLLQHMFV